MCAVDIFALCSPLSQVRRETFAPFLTPSNDGRRMEGRQNSDASALNMNSSKYCVFACLMKAHSSGIIFDFKLHGGTDTIFFFVPIMRFDAPHHHSTKLQNKLTTI